jgi:hypothetical protein
VALADSAILAHDERSVTFRYRDSDTGKSHPMTLPVMEFIRRFLQHVLPSGFVKVRYYGLHHPSRRKTLTLVRAALCVRKNIPIPVLLPPSEPKPYLCPTCQTPMVKLRILTPVRTFPARARAPPESP